MDLQKKLLTELKKDLIEEKKEIIKKELYKFFIDEIVRKATASFPEWYKEQLLKKAFKQFKSYIPIRNGQTE
jgi:hypothetical protein